MNFVSYEENAQGLPTRDGTGEQFEHIPGRFFGDGENDKIGRFRARVAPRNPLHNLSIVASSQPST